MTGGPVPSPVLDLLRGPYTSKRDVVRAIGDAMIAAGAVTPAYVEGMLRKEEQGTTIVMPGVALPHGTVDVRHAVLRNAIVVVPLPDGVEWTPGQTVSLAIGFAGAGDAAHLRLMGTIARLLSDGPVLSRLKAATDSGAVAALLQSLER